jgi:hypothetical protein
MGRILSRELTKSANPKLDGAGSSRFMVDLFAGFPQRALRRARADPGALRGGEPAGPAVPRRLKNRRIDTEVLPRKGQRHVAWGVSPR